MLRSALSRAIFSPEANECGPAAACGKSYSMVPVTNLTISPIEPAGFVLIFSPDILY